MVTLHRIVSMGEQAGFCMLVHKIEKNLNKFHGREMPWF